MTRIAAGFQHAAFARLTACPNLFPQTPLTMQDSAWCKNHYTAKESAKSTINMQDVAYLLIQKPNPFKKRVRFS
ncbi:hypothetical protein UZ35_11040 [Heyndrickxia coagulans]|nr:hypothetical protein CIW84_15705 [Heyndrickxia coagulans]KGB30322.1 hypothetical protein IE89_05375 [Heyndrickxia coagulans]KXT20145.1 hypothetical protein UZ35_11040 [Heyndrickxia coagulans]OZV93492.1 hypothetical protein CAY57_14350 [Heyndrickxia coagulans]RCS34314.1 hypothetical protein DN050_14885 [Heyndrickxia coagulans]